MTKLEKFYKAKELIIYNEDGTKSITLNYDSLRALLQPTSNTDLYEVGINYCDVDYKAIPIDNVVEFELPFKKRYIPTTEFTLNYLQLGQFSWANIIAGEKFSVYDEIDVKVMAEDRLNIEEYKIKFKFEE